MPAAPRVAISVALDTPDGSAAPDGPEGPERLLDPGFIAHPWRYLLQCGLCTLVIGGIMLLLDVFLHAAIITSLGATTFIVFALPHSRSAHPRRLLGGYGWGLLTGLACQQLADRLAWEPTLVEGGYAILWGALAIGLATLLMVATNTEHPPAAGCALSLVLQPWDLRALLFVVATVVLLAATRYALRRVLINLA